MNPFERLAPFIQEFIYRSGWNELRDVQTEAIHAILDTPRHVLITSGTASGKTEAAFFPILTELWNRPSDTFGVLYIGPLKALIDDQFRRIQALIEEAGLPIFAWHGDRPAAEKAKAAQHPKGILQITPESLEALLMAREGQARAMLGDLRFLVIDELHAFLGADRGLQLQCLMTRINRLIGRDVRRVGLSATIQSAGAAGEWLAAGSERETMVVASASGGRKLNLSLRHDALLADEQSPAYQQIRNDRFHALYAQAAGQKSLIFTNSRMEAEDTAAALSEIAREKGEADIFRVHHGSISAAMRGDTEASLRASDSPAAVVTTKTLELGIDLGGLQKVIQLGAPSTCSSFVQRLGRTGRRGDAAVMRFFTADSPRPEEPMGEMPWELLQNIAVIQLYLEEQWVEPFDPKPLPFSVLFHQTLSHLMTHECTGRELARAVLTLPPFQAVEPLDYRALLEHMLATDMIEKMENGVLIPGLAGEKLAGNYRFYSVFPDVEGYRVLHQQRFLGEIDHPPQVGKGIRLCGRGWMVEEINQEKRTVYVRPHNGKCQKQWSSGAPAIDEKIVKKMRDVLLSETVYPYLQPNAQAALAAARQAAKAYRLKSCFTPIDSQRFLLHPWLGTKTLETLAFLMRQLPKEKGESDGIRMLPPVGIVIETEEKPWAWLRRFAKKVQGVDQDDLFLFLSNGALDCYDAFLPERLRRKATACNSLDFPGVQKWIQAAGLLREEPPA